MRTKPHEMPLLFGPPKFEAASVSVDVLSLVADPVICTDESGRILFFNEAAEKSFGYSSAEVIGQDVGMLLPERHRVEHAHQVRDFASQTNSESRLMGHKREVWGRRQDGVEFPAEAAVSRHSMDGRTVLTVVHRDISVRKHLEDQREAIAQELDHRIKNLLTVFSSLVSLSAKSAASVTEFKDALQERIRALAATQSLLRRDPLRGVLLNDLLSAELAQYRNSDGANVVLQGEQVALLSTAVQPLALAIHELGTNSAKYGAFTKPCGRVTITSEYLTEENNRQLVIEWRETGGPRVKPPERKGFGTTLIKQVIEKTFAAAVALDYRPDGLVCRIVLPSAKVEDVADR